jgi:hypothetical protein
MASANPPELSYTSKWIWKWNLVRRFLSKTRSKTNIGIPINRSPLFYPR